MALDLLCHLTFPPDSGRDPEDTNALIGAWWQTFINDLTEIEKDQIIDAMRVRISDLEGRRQTLQAHEIAELTSLNSFLKGKMS
jgi:hypothetical protein